MTQKLSATEFEKLVDSVKITDDIAFGNVIQKGDNCLHLLQAIFPELGIVKVHFERQKQEKENSVFKGIVFDVVATDQQGIVYDIEMQTTLRSDLGRRVRFYQSKLDEITLNAGQNYSKLRNSFVIFICTDDPFRQNLRRYTFSHFCEELPQLHLETGAKIIFLNSQGKVGKVSDSLQNFFDLMHGKINVKDSFVESLSSDLANLKQDPEWRREFMNLQMKLADAKMDGVEEGIQIGIQRSDRNTLSKYIASLRKKNLTNSQIRASIQETFGDFYSEDLINELLK